MLACHFSRFRGRIDRGDVRPSGRERSVQLAWHDVAFDAGLERHDEHVGRAEGLVQQLFWLIGKEPEVRQAPHLAGTGERRSLHSIADDREHDIRPAAQPIGGLDDHLQVLRRADISRVHDDELVDQAVRPSERVVARGRRDRFAVGPVMNGGDARWVGAFFFDKTALHPRADRHDEVGVRRSDIG